MKTVTSAEMRALERRAAEEFGIPSLLLMENAGRGVADLISSGTASGRVAIFAGKGNNGGDGFVAARHLHNRGFQVKILLFADPQKLKGDAAFNFQIVSKMKIPCVILSEAKDLVSFSAKQPPCGVVPDGTQNDSVRDSDLIVDAIFGTGLTKPLEGIYALAVKTINESGCRVLAVDIPSGIDSDTGEMRGIAVKASMTAVLGLAKQGLLHGEGPRHAGEIHVVDIGLPA